VLSAQEHAIIREARAGKAEAAHALAAGLRLSEDRRLWLSGAVQLHLASNATEKMAACATLHAALTHRWATPQTKVFALLDLSAATLEVNGWDMWQEMRRVAGECEQQHMGVEHVPAALAGFWLNNGLHHAMERRPDEAITSFERALRDRSQGNWCTRYTALNHLTRQMALKGEVRPDLVEAALAEVPLESANKFAGTAMLTEAYLLFAQSKLAEAQLMGVNALRQAQAEKDPFEVVMVDLFLVRVSLARGDRADAEILNRIQRNGQKFPFAPVLASRLLKEKEVKECVSVS
jgi:hypothetical protein